MSGVRGSCISGSWCRKTPEVGWRHRHLLFCSFPAITSQIRRACIIVSPVITSIARTIILLTNQAAGFSHNRDSIHGHIRRRLQIIEKNKSPVGVVRAGRGWHAAHAVRAARFPARPACAPTPFRHAATHWPPGRPMRWVPMAPVTVPVPAH